MGASDTAAPIVQGRALLRQRRDTEALICFEKACADFSANAAVIIGRCTALLRLGRLDAALGVADAALRQHPQLNGIEGVRAQILLLAGRIDESARAADRGCVGVPKDPVALFVRGLLLLERNEADGALAAFEEAIVLDASLAAAYLGRASALTLCGSIAEILAAFELARQMDEHNANVPVRLGHWLIRLNRFDAAAAAFADALVIDGRHAAALRGHAQCLAAVGRAPEAVDAYARLRAVEPDAPYMRGERFHLQLHCSDWDGFLEEQQTIEAGVRRCNPVANPGSFMTHNESAADQLLCARSFATDAFAIDDPLAPDVRTHPFDDRRRIAYLSADFGAHATSYLAAGLFEAHDRSKFETFAISFGPDDDSAMRARLVRAFDHFVDVRHLSDREIAAHLRTLGIDLAIDLKGHTRGARPRIFAYRPAPVQVSFLGYPGTLGTDCIDYLVADHTVVPQSQRIHYSERIIYMPESYQVNDTSRAAGAMPSRRVAGLPDAGFVFCCFNNVYKITPPVFADWMQILRAVPASVLWLLQADAATANLRRAAHSHGVDADRLIFAPWLPALDHLARCALADLFLDTLPYNAHTTASDALWSGVPVVTRASSSFASRVATSLLHAVGLDQLSVVSRAQYIRLATRLAHAPTELAALKQALAVARERSTLFDSARYCRRIESAFAEVIDRDRRGVAPTDLEVRA